MGTNDFLPFGGGGAANVIDQATYAALAARLTGFQSGTAQSAQLNKVWRQSSIMAAVLAQFIVNQTGQNATDDGTTATLLSNLATAVAVSARQNPVLVDTGTANTYAVANLAAFPAYPTVSGLVIDVSIANANTGASTLNVDGLGAKPIYGLALQPLQGGELVVKGVACFLYVVASTVNSGNGAWILMECAGGAQQVAPATQSQHAAQLNQVGFQNIVVYRRIAGVVNVSVNGGAFTTSGASSFTVPVSGRFKPRVWGAGGGGGSGVTSAAATGGGGGGYAEGVIIATPGSSQPITVGAGGAGGTGSGNGTAGGTSSVGSLISATGGGGGIGSASGAASGSSVAGGTGSGGSFNITGQGPASAYTVSSSLLASGGGGSFGAAPSAISVGSATGAIFPGGAGGGGANNNVGQSGADGVVIIEY
ncbi:hypothetical protein [Burkholderia ubonensis]|uniref:glycine-rich domain-containing protein n=1 Tax=Burkholderia ubonensis TaxID=101571 RepID=UPI000AF0D226|nr:hypothetical protein [Burkholderia ubonensis]